MPAAGSLKDPLTHASSLKHSTRQSAWTLLGVALCFALSGFAALLYQTAWMRQFSLVFGTSELAVATVLAAYMGGLALGAIVIEHWLDRVRKPVFLYGLLEFGIGAAACAVPLLLLGAERLMVWMIGGQADPPASQGWIQTGFYVFTAFAVLVVPTAFMGATLPLLTRHLVHTPEQIGSRTGLLYATNTAGAVGGALVAAFVLLPAIGLKGTVLIGAATNVAVFGFAALIARASPPLVVRSAPGPACAAPAQIGMLARLAPGPHWILPVMLVSGAISFLYEVLWTRMLSFILGGSIYAFATMVASFLLGIAVGSALAARLARSRRLALITFVVCQLAIALCSIAIYLSLERFLPKHAGLAGNAALAIAVLLPATLFIGATYPLAVRTLTDDPLAAGRAAARVYAWNTLGAIAGALLAGFLIIPTLRFEGAIYLAVLANMALAAIVCLAVARAAPLWSAGTLAASLAVALLFRPAVPEQLLKTSPLNVAANGVLHYYGVGRSATVVMLEQDGALILRTNGLPEALIDMPGSVPRFSGEFWLSPLAVIARPAAKNMLIVGYGGGVVVDGVPPSVRAIDVIELEPQVIEANRLTRELHKRDSLADPRVHLIINDARGALALTAKHYDAIVSQPSHPWTAGASHLYTREFMQQARNHLNDGGVFVQWMNISFLDAELLRSMAATLLDVFGQLRLYRPDPNTLVFVASTQPLEIETALARSGVPLSYSPRHYARFGIQVVEDLVAALVADQEGAQALARGAGLLTDDLNRMATANIYERGRSLTPETTSRLLDAYDPLQRAASWIYASPELQLSFSYLARRMALFTSIDARAPNRIRRMAALLPDPSTAAYAQAIARSAVGDTRGSTRLLQESLALDPRNQTARFELLRPWLPVLAQKRAPPEIAAAATQLTGSVTAVVEAARHAAIGEWTELPALDRSLRETGRTDAWYFESLQLRADWRTRVSNPGVRLRLGREALALVEEALISQPTPGMLALRARSAVAADRPDVLLESISNFAQGAISNLSRSVPRDLPQLDGALEAFLAALERLDHDPRIREQRRIEVRDRVQAARQQIQTVATTDPGAPE